MIWMLIDLYSFQNSEEREIKHWEQYSDILTHKYTHNVIIKTHYITELQDVCQFYFHCNLNFIPKPYKNENLSYLHKKIQWNLSGGRSHLCIIESLTRFLRSGSYKDITFLQISLFLTWHVRPVTLFFPYLDFNTNSRLGWSYFP